MTRGVYELAFRSVDGHAILVAISRDGRRVHEVVVTDEAQRSMMLAIAWAVLDAADPEMCRLRAI